MPAIYPTSTIPLCRLLLEACGTATESGTADIVPFTIDMPRLFERYVARLLQRNVTGSFVDAQVALDLGPQLRYSVDVVLRAGAGGRPLAVLDTKYKDHDSPKPDDVQQIVFYATVLGCTEAYLVYPRPIAPLRFNAGGVTVRTIALDLAASGQHEGTLSGIFDVLRG